MDAQKYKNHICVHNGIRRSKQDLFFTHCVLVLLSLCSVLGGIFGESSIGTGSANVTVCMYKSITDFVPVPLLRVEAFLTIPGYVP